MICFFFFFFFFFLRENGFTTTNTQFCFVAFPFLLLIRNVSPGRDNGVPVHRRWGDVLLFGLARVILCPLIVLFQFPERVSVPCCVRFLPFLASCENSLVQRCSLALATSLTLPNSPLTLLFF